MTLPLRSSPPPQEAEEGAENNADSPCAEGGEDAPQLVRSPSAGASKKKSPLVQAPAKGGEQEADQEPSDGCNGASTENPDSIVWEKQEVPASNESFFFAIPPLSELTGSPNCPDAQDQDAAAAVASAAAVIPGDQSASGKPQPGPVSPTSPEGDQQADTVPPEEVNTAVSLLVSLNGNDWQPVSGPSLTYFQPPPEPVVEVEEETKKKGKKK